MPAPDLLTDLPGRLEEVCVVSDSLERLERGPTVHPEGPRQGADRCLDVVIVRHLDRRRSGLEDSGREDAVNPLPERRSGCEHGDAEERREPFGVDRDPPPGRLIDHIQDDDHREAVLGHLEEEVEVALEARGAQDRYDHIGVLLLQEPADQNLFARFPVERVDAGKIHEFDHLALETGVAPLQFDGGPGVVAHLHPETGELVEDQGFADAGVADQRKLHGHDSTMMDMAISGLMAISQPFTLTTTEWFGSFRRICTISPGKMPRSSSLRFRRGPRIIATRTVSPSLQSRSVQASRPRQCRARPGGRRPQDRSAISPAWRRRVRARCRGACS